jgi:hypothetical protein
MIKDIEKTFKEKLYECDKHVEKITVSKNHLHAFMPLSVETYLKLNDVDISFIDQLIFRFSKLQDSMGEKIFPAILVLAKEEVKKKTFIDILNRLEELEILDKAEWLKLREIRNDIAHEYSFNKDEVVDSIIAIYNASDDLMSIYRATCDFCKNNLKSLGLGDSDSTIKCA